MGEVGEGWEALGVGPTLAKWLKEVRKWARFSVTGISPKE